MMLEKKVNFVTVIAVYVCLSIREVIVGAFRALIFGKEDTTKEEERNGPSQVNQTKNKDGSESNTKGRSTRSSFKELLLYSRCDNNKEDPLKFVLIR